MTQQHPFRFGVNAFQAPSPDVWIDQARRAEGLGYDVFSTGEHIVSDLDPISALASAAMQTSRIRLGSLTFSNDFRNPVMRAKEVASLDVLSGGRFEFGIGAGYTPSDYTQAGIPFDPPGTRLSRLFEAVHLVKRAFTEESVDFDGTYYSVRELSLKPRPVQRPWPPLVIGGGGKRVLEFAAREADIVGIGIKFRPDGWFDWANVSPEATVEKVHWVREAAGDRFSKLELNWMVFFCAVTDDPEAAARTYLENNRWQDQVSVEDLLASPIALVGSEDAIVELLHRRREEYGISYITVFGPLMETFAPIVARLSGK